MNNLSFEYTLRRSQRAKKTRIIVTAEKVEVVAPSGVAEDKICAFVKSKQGWIVAASLKIKQKKQGVERLGPERYVDGAEVPYHGGQLKIRLKPSSGEKIKIKCSGSELIIFLPKENIAGKGCQLIRVAIVAWIKKQALKDVNSYLTLHCCKQGLHPRSIRLKKQKSRWGSCGIHNDINLNWLLVLAPPKVMEYVVVHEICHIKERNHSAQFWLLVEEHLPDYKQHRLWLKQNGSRLMQGL
jgi:predicted metal-dependent hydrolase